MSDIDNKQLNINGTDSSENSLDWTDKLRYSKSFVAKLALSDESVKRYYAAIASKLLAYNRVRSRTRWNGVSFAEGRTVFARLTITGKTLCLYLAVEPSTVADSKYRAKDVSDVRKYEKTPSLFRIRSDGALNNALRLIDRIAAENGLVARENATEIYAKDFPPDSFDNLLTRGLIRLLKQNGGANAATVAENDDIDETDDNDGEVTATDSEEVATKTPAEEHVEADTDNDGIYPETVAAVNKLVGKFKSYEDILENIDSGDTSVSFSRKTMLRSIDEAWISAIESCLDALDTLVRNPTHYIAETEEVLPIEMTKKITGRSVVHLCQHTNYITTDGDDIIPKKMLNIFRDDSIQTYENRFLNTLLARLSMFVERRYDVAVRRGADETVDEINFTSTFDDGDNKGRVTINVQYMQDSAKTMRNPVVGTELWKRIQRIRMVVGEYMRSDFVVQMEHKYVNPPIMRTNAILKNKYFRQCLALWEFIESYDDAGYGLVVDQQAVDVDEQYCGQLAKAAAMQYMIFRHNAFGEYDEDGVLNRRTTADVKPRIVDKLPAFAPSEYDEEAAEERVDEGETDIELALRVALAADEKYVPPVVEAETKADYVEGEDESDDDITLEEDERWKGVGYTKTFNARLRLTTDEVKRYFVEIANKLTGYDKVKLRISNRFATFNCGRATLARINVTGKTLYFYVALPAEGLAEKYFVRDVSARKAVADTPSLLRVKSDRGLKYAQELVDALVAEYNLVPSKKPQKTYTVEEFARISFAELIEKGWIKLKNADGFTPPEREQTVEPTVTSDSNENYDETANDEVAADVAEDSDEDAVSDVRFGGVAYTKTFNARLRLTTDEVKRYYVEIVNKLAGYNKVKLRVSNRFATFNRGRTTLARINVTGKSLCFYVALPAEGLAEKYFVRDVSARKAVADTPSLLRVKSDRGLKYALELVDGLVVEYDLKPSKKQQILHTVDEFAYMSVDELIAAGWIRRKQTVTAIAQENETNPAYPDYATGADEARQSLTPEQMAEAAAGDLYHGSPKPVEQTATVAAEPVVVPVVAEDTADEQAENAENLVANSRAEQETLPDIVQVAPQSYDVPTDYGIDDSGEFIKDMSKSQEPDEPPTQKGFFSRLFGRYRRDKRNEKKKKQ